jgi:transposase
MKILADDPQHAFPGQGQMKPEQAEIARLKRKRFWLHGKDDGRAGHPARP